MGEDVGGHAPADRLDGDELTLAIVAAIACFPRRGWQRPAHRQLCEYLGPSIIAVVRGGPGNARRGYEENQSGLDEIAHDLADGLAGYHDRPSRQIRRDPGS